MNKKARITLVGILSLLLILSVLLVHNFVFVSGEENPQEDIVVSRTLTSTTYQTSDGKFYITSGGFMNYFNGSEFKEINTTITSYNQDGYDYVMLEAPYKLYLKSNSNWGDGVKFCIEDNCLIYQSQDMSFRNQDGSQDYISNIQNSQVEINDSIFTYPTIYPNVNLNMVAYGGLLKEKYILNEKPREPAGYLGNNVTLDFGGYIKFGDLDMYVNDILVSNNFKTSERIDFKLNNNSLFHIPKPIAYDSNGSQINLEYEVKTQGQQIWFYVRTPYSWLNDSERVYPVYIDPSVGPNSPETVVVDDSVGTVGWYYLGNVVSEDNNSAESDDIGGEATDPIWSDDVFAQIIKSDGNLGTENKAYNLSGNFISAVPHEGFDGYREYGNSTDLWNENWNYSDINSENFGFAISYQSEEQTHYLKVSNFSFSISSEKTTIDGIKVEVKDYEDTGRQEAYVYVDHIRITVYYTEDTTPPNVTINSPLNQTYNTQNILFNVTAIDDIGMSNCSYSLDAGLNNVTMTNSSTSPSNWNATDTSVSEGSQTASFFCTDINNNINNSESVTFFVDSINPDISYDGTENNNTNFSRTWIYVNVSASDTNEDTITFNLYDSTHTLESSASYTDGTRNKNFTGLSDGLYYYNVTINDTLNNQNSTKTRAIRLDTTPPSTTPTMTSPPGGASYTNGTWTNESVKITMITTDLGVGFDGTSFPKYCTDTTNTCNPNTFISSGATITDEGISYIRFNASDKLNNAETIKSRTTKIDKTPPNVTIVYPTSGVNLSINTSISLNFTSFDALTNVSGCRYSINSGINVTIENCQNTTINVSEGSINIQLYFNDSVGNLNYSESIDFTSDLTNPDVSIVFPLNNSNSSNNGLNVNFTRSDSITEIDTCWYSNDTMLKNTTLGSGLNITGITWTDALHNVSIWCNDSSGRENVSRISFTIDTINPNISYNPSTTTNNTFRQTGDIFINITAQDINLENVSFEWDGINESFSTISGDYYSENKTGLAEGAYGFYAWANDSAGNFNSTGNYTIFIDLNNPSLNLVHPKSQTYNVQNISLNYTVSDTYLETCWYTNDTAQINITLSNCQNTSLNMSEGNHNLTIWANDSSGRVSSDFVEFVVSLSPPSVSLDFPTDELWLNYSEDVNFNITATDGSLDSIELWQNWSGTWEVNQTNLTAVSGVTTTFKVNLSDGNYTWNARANNSGNYWAWGSPFSNFTLGIDTTYPLIDFTATTIANNTNSTSTNISVTVDITEAYEKNITFRLYNDVGSYNISNFTDGRRTINWVSLPDDNYFVNVSISDFAGNTNTTSTLEINLDDTAPTITIVEPQAQNYGNNNSIELNYSAIDNLLGVEECWYYVLNSSSDIIITTTTLTDCQNTTFKLPGGDIDYTLYLFAKDFLENTNSKTRTFGIRTNSPAVSLSPGNDSHRNYLNNHYFNFSATTNADSISTCSFYHNITGTFELNQTKTSISESTTYSFVINSSEIQFLWNINCSDNFGTIGWGLNNQTYIVDVTNPEIDIISLTKSTGSQTFNFNTSVSDKYLPTTSCKYTIFDSLGNIDGISENVSFTCNEQKSATATAFGTFNLTTYAEDKAGNENLTSELFTLSPASPVVTGGGGGTVIVVGTNETAWSITTAQGTIKYEIFKVAGASRSFDLLFENLGESARTISLRCEIVEGTLCDYVSFENQTFNLPVAKNISYRTSFTIDFPEKVSPQVEIFNIEAKDDLGLPASLTVEARKASIIISFFIKLGYTKQIFGIGIPYWFILLFSSAITGIGGFLLVPKESKAKGIIVTGISIFFGIVLTALL